MLLEARAEGAEAARKLLASNEALAAARALAVERERELVAARRAADSQATRFDESAREAAAQVGVGVGHLMGVVLFRRVPFRGGLQALGSQKCHFEC